MRVILALVITLGLAACSSVAERDEERYLERFTNLSDTITLVHDQDPGYLLFVGDSACDLYALDYSQREIWELMRATPQADHLDNADWMILWRTVAEHSATDLCPADYGHLRWD